MGLIDERLYLSANMATREAAKILQKKISNDKYTITFDGIEDDENITFIGSENNKKMYWTNNYDCIQVSLEENSDKFLENIDINKLLSTEENNINPQGSAISSYQINGLEYKYKTVTYEGMDSSVMLYFVCPIDANNSYAVTIETDGNISLETINEFLNIQIEQKNSNSDLLLYNDYISNDILNMTQNMAESIELETSRVNEILNGLL